MKKRLSIKDKLLIYFGTIIVTGFLICGLVADLLCKDIIYNKAMTSLARLAKDTADKISIMLDEKQRVIEGLSRLDGLSDESKTLEEKLEILRQYNEVIGFKDLAIIDLDGNSYGTSGVKRNIAGSREYESAKQGQTGFSLAIEVNSEDIFTIATPIKLDNGEVGAVLMGVESSDKFYELMIKAGISDEIMILDNEGNVILHSNEVLMKKTLSMDEMHDKSEYEDVYKLYQNMLSGEIGAMECKEPETNEKNFVSYAPIASGWSIGLISYREGVINVVLDFKKNLLIAVAVTIALGVGAVYAMAKRLAERLSEITSHMDTVAQGNFEKDIPEELLELGDEMGDAARALDTMKTGIEDMLEAIKSCTDYMNEQMEDLTEDVKKEIKVMLSTDETDTEKKEQIVEKINALHQISEYVNSRDFKVDEDSI